MSTSWGRTISYPHLAPDWAAVIRLPASVSASMTTRPGPQRASSPMTSRLDLRFLTASTGRGFVATPELAGEMIVTSRTLVGGESGCGPSRSLRQPRLQLFSRGALHWRLVVDLEMEISCHPAGITLERPDPRGQQFDGKSYLDIGGVEDSWGIVGSHSGLPVIGIRRIFKCPLH
jgi:hypothetical protein